MKYRIRGTIGTQAVDLVVDELTEPPARTPVRGVNLSGLSDRGQWYEIPPPAAAHYWSDVARYVRIPIWWERLEPSYGNIDMALVKEMDKLVDQCAASSVVPILCIHNMAQRAGAAMDQAAWWQLRFTLVWLAKRYPVAEIGPMNEPHDTVVDLGIEYSLIAKALRDAGCENHIRFEGNGWNNAWAWNNNWYGRPNAQVFTEIVDPMNNWSVDVHVYDNAPAGMSYADQLKDISQWCADNNRRYVIGEFHGTEANCRGLIQAAKADERCDGFLWWESRRSDRTDSVYNAPWDAPNPTTGLVRQYMS